MASNIPISQSKNLPILSVRGSEGVFLLSPHESDYSQLNKFNGFHDESKNSRITAFDSLGNQFAYCNNSHVKIIDLNDNCKTTFTIEKPRTSYLKFSPKGTYLILWENFYVSKEDHKDIPNLSVYETSTGKLYKSFVCKKHLENLVQWSNDEKSFAVLVQNEILFFEKSDPEKISTKIKLDNLSAFSLNHVSNHIAVHVAGKKSEPSFLRIFKYPDLTNVIANKSFFNADKVEFKWNKSGNNLLLLCSTETSENSYYGDTTLHQIGMNGESQFIQLSKKGPIYSLEWNPNRDEFIVVYGTIPAKATLFNSKCDAIYDFGTGPRNEIFFNPHGNIVCLAGFGNLRGRIEIWNLSTSNRVPQELCSVLADDTTYFEWSSDGEHFLTATTAPRLRVSNGYKLWNYSGEKKYTYQMPQNCELWQIQWQPGNYPQKQVVKKTTAAPVKEETKAYVPPHLRGLNKPSDFKSKLHDDDEKPDKNLKLKVKVERNESEEKEKKLKTLKKKLAQIEDLKKKQASGEKLEKNQLDKLKSENELVDEIKKLST